MQSPSSSCRPVPLIIFYLLVLMSNFAEARRSLTGRIIPGPVTHNVSDVPALFVFGDSTVDAGNNNFIKTITKSNFPPYGRDFPNHIPTGRFTNGRLVTDFLAAYVGIKEYVPAYLDPTFGLDHQLKTGVCFASAGTGFDPLTAQLSGVIPIERQLGYFKEYKAKMEGKIGKERTTDMINKGLFVISAGTNDFILNYFGPPIRSQTYSISTYQDFLLQIAQRLLQGLLEMGARRIGFVGLPPVGCLPAVITANSLDAFTKRGCIERLSSVARDYNRLLQSKLKKSTQSHGAKIVYIDIYNPIEDMVKNPQQFGLEKVNKGCCGSGIIETAILCNPYSVICSDESKYVFWDAVHPTEAAYFHIFQSVRPAIDQIFI
ncbi:hypothetical protein ABFS82_13G100900 [Erythranthe guttata]|uniref:Uncharacterized protein n=1 Tax=Erythranthe guttata TaxID=4155 RepID=A0A022QH72_ERYGU|nr:PREDICTED: GDSL esterase/lipase At5g45960-like [Erythranthe guttata]EYU28037.1 hypothetical protein MIMGU_mgv1a008421mg [Erythranthe guttata]|eukprot:XP_012848804.1 PREDICTED: GDSL esterase/lipase At5g45960-like [Erythranthe guttata]